MANLFVVDGAHGAGKTDLLQHIDGSYAGSRFATYLKKFSTRQRSDAAPDIVPVSREDFAKHVSAEDFLHYEYSNEYYGLHTDELDQLLAQFANVFVIVRSHAVVKSLFAKYRSHRVITVFIYADLARIKRHLRIQYKQNAAKRGVPVDPEAMSAEITKRTRRSLKIWKDYVREPFLYDEIIINNFDITTYQSLIEALLGKYNRREA